MMIIPHVFYVTILLLWGIMIVAVGIDLWTGMDKAKALQQTIRSNGLRRTIAKLGEYWRIECMFSLFDLIALLAECYTLPYGSLACTAAVVLIEARSVVENLHVRRGAARELLQITSKIIRCTTKGDALKLIDKIRKE